MAAVMQNMQGVSGVGQAYAHDQRQRQGAVGVMGAFVGQTKSNDYKALEEKEKDTYDGKHEEDSEDEEEKKKKKDPPINPVLQVISCGRAPFWMHDVLDDSFNMMVGLIIVLNAIIIGMETDLGDTHFQFFEHFFCIFFILEMAMRIWQLGCHGYVSDGSNLFDGSLVISGTVDLYLMPIIMGAHNKGGGPASTLRLLRMLRVMRILRLFKVFRELSIILQAFLKAFSAVMWVSVLTLILDYVCAVFLTKTVGHKAAMFDEDQEKVRTWFGSIGNSMRTLFIIMTLAEWDEIALTLQEKIHGLIVFGGMVFYIMVAAFTMVSLITGIICEALLRAQNEDEQNKMDEIEEKKASFRKDLRDVLEKLDKEDKGYLTKDMMEEQLNDPKVAKRVEQKLATLDVEMDKDGFLELVRKVASYHVKSPDKEDEPEGIVYVGELIEQMQLLQGNAKASAVWDLKHQVEMLGNMQDDMEKMIDKLQETVNKAGGRK